MPASVPASAADEDWRGQLNQLTGGTCQWIPDASFVACNSSTFIGWEPINRRYVLWSIDVDSGETQVFPGAIGGGEWTFGDIELRRKSPTEWQLLGKGAVADLQITAAPGPVPLALTERGPASAEWRTPIETFVASWTFEGSDEGKPLTYDETCRWIQAATFIACKVKGRKSVSLIGWEPHNQRFVHYGVRPDGKASVVVGTFEDNGWVFVGGPARVSMKFESPVRATYKVELRGDDGKYVLAADGIYTAHTPE